MDQFVVRMPAGMRDRLKKAADLSHRSMNAQLVLYVERGLQPTTKEGQQP